MIEPNEPSSPIENQLVSPPTTATGNTGCAAVALIFLAIFWLIPITCVGQLSPLIASALPGDKASTAGLIAGFGRLVLIGLPVAGIAFSWRTTLEGAVARAWLKALVLTAIWLFIHLVPAIHTQFQSLLQILIGGAYLLFILVLDFLGRRNLTSKAPSEHQVKESKIRSSTRIGWASGLGLVMLYPWLVNGALGSTIDIILAATFSLVIGAVSVAILQTSIPSFYTHDQGQTSRSQFAYTGLAVAGVLAIAAGSVAYPFGTMQMFLLAALPGLGWAVGALLLPIKDGRYSSQLAPILLIALAAFGPLALIDPDETTLVAAASPGELLQFAYLAAVLAFILSVVISLAAVLVHLLAMRSNGGLRRSPAPILPWLFLAAALAGGAVLYTRAGTPGRYGENLFVILMDQADLTAEARIDDPIERRRAVFKRLVEHADSTQAPIRVTLDRFGVDYTPYYLVNAIEIEDNLLARIWLRIHPQVDRILVSPVMRPLPQQPPLAPNAPEASPPSPLWSQSLIHADQVWDELGITGEGILIGQSDSGVDGSHPELASSFRGSDGHGDSWFDPWNGSDHPLDLGGHGTHTLGTIVGQNVGVAPGATWIACVNLARNLGSPALYLDCWQFNFAPFKLGGDPFRDGDPARGANILNNSWGCPDLEGCDLHTFDAAVAALRTAGIFVVASAGNDGPACGSLSVPPPTYPATFAVGAIDSAGDLTNFSSIGSGQITPDVVAPGQEVLSSLPGGGYGTNSGTSMAGPHAAGVVALMWSANPSLIGDVELTENILHETASPYNGTLPACPGVEDTPSTAVGYGVIDAYAAVMESMRSR